MNVNFVITLIFIGLMFFAWVDSGRHDDCYPKQVAIEEDL